MGSIRIDGRRIGGGLLAFFIIATTLLQMSWVLPAHAASETYAWTDGTHIQQTGGANLVFHQVTTDDVGTALGGASAPSGTEMVLESTPTNDPNTSCNANDVGNSGGADTITNPALFVDDGSGGTPAEDAYFGKGELLVVQNYLKATSAQLITFNDSNNACAANGPVTVSLSGNPNYGQWQSAVGSNGQTEIQIKNVTTGDTFTETSVSNGTMTLNGPTTAPDGHPCGPQTITIGSNTNSFETAAAGTLTISSTGSTPGGTCQTSSSPITMINSYAGPQGVETTGTWSGTQDPSGQITITKISSADAGFVTVGQIFAEPQCAGSCTGFTPPIDTKTNTMTLNGGIITSGVCSGNKNEDVLTVSPYQTAQTGTAVVYGPGLRGSGCIKRMTTISITDGYAGTTTGGNNPGTSNNCVIPGNNPFTGWLICPIFDLIQSTTTLLSGIVASQLVFNVNQYFSSGIQTAFDTFRNLGVALLVIAGLVMVISQAADLEIFSAHTVRKALPRLIIAAILISLSWPLLKFTVGLFNDLGEWIGQIILQSVASTAQPGDVVGWMFSAIGDVLLGILGTAATFVALGIGGVLSLFVSIFFLFLLGIVVLTVRIIVILVAVLITPIAIASFVLPGTERLGRFWRDTLIATLAMFPIIMAFLAAGAALAEITLSVNSGNYWYHVLAIIFFFAPYFMLPFAFRIAGGLMERIVSWAQGTHNQTIAGGLQKFRQGQIAKNIQRVGAGSRYNPNNPWTNVLGGRLVNRLGSRVGATAQGHLPWGGGNAAARSNNAWMTADTAAKLDSNFAAQMNNEGAMAAVAFGNNRNALLNLDHYWNHDAAGRRTTLRQNVDARTGRSTDAVDDDLAAGRTIKATQQMQIAAADALARSGKVLQSRDDLDLLTYNVAHGNRSIEGAVKGQYQFTSRQVGRADIGRDTDVASLEELDISSIIKQKPQSLENLFGMRNPSGGAPGIVQAINASTNPVQRQHFADVLFAAQYNASLSPQQLQHVQVGIDRLTRTPIPGADMARAAANYRSKFNIPSDRRLKTNITHLHTLENGIKLYSFIYIWGGPTYVGVMAQDLLHTYPEAVLIGTDGYYRVDYTVLGLEMVELADWHIPSREKSSHLVSSSLSP